MKSWLLFSLLAAAACAGGVAALQGWVSARFGTPGLLSLYVGTGVSFLLGLGSYAWLLAAVRKPGLKRFQALQVSVMGGMMIRLGVVGILGWTAHWSGRFHIASLLLSFLGFTLGLLVLEYVLLYGQLKRGADAARD